MALTRKEMGVASTPLADGFAVVAARLHRSTVQVRAHGPGGGSGVIWRPSGVIITNAHVARRPHATVELSDGRVFEAVVTASDPARDLALLKVEAADLPAALIGDSRVLRVGDLVCAVGQPWGVTGALTVGMIHALGPANGSSDPEWVRADVRLAPGNSGGPLADAQGQVIGLNSLVVGGLALAVPSHAVERFLDTRTGRPFLGVTVRPVWLSPADRRVFGLLVLEVASGGPAAAAGLILGDVLIGAVGRGFRTPRDLSRALATMSPGEVLALDLIRGGKRITCNVIVRANTDGAEAA